MSEQKNGLAEMAALATKLPGERRREIERQLPFTGNPKHDSGLALGLSTAVTLLAKQPSEVVESIRDAAAVAADCALRQEADYARMREEMNDPAVRAALEAEAELIRMGKVELIPLEDALNEIEQMAAKLTAAQCNGASSEGNHGV